MAEESRETHWREWLIAGVAVGSMIFTAISSYQQREQVQAEIAALASQRVEAEGNERAERPSLQVSWFEVDDLAELALPRLQKFAATDGTVRGPDLGVSLEESAANIIASGACSCGAVVAEFSARGLQVQSDSSAHWVYLVISQEGGGTALDVTIKGKITQPGALQIFDLTDIYRDPNGQVSASENDFIGDETTLNVGAMRPQERIIVPLFILAYAVPVATNQGEAEATTGTAFNATNGFIPLTITYRDTRGGDPANVDVRQPSLDAAYLTQGLITRG